MSDPDVLGLLLSEGIKRLDASGVAYEVKRLSDLSVLMEETKCEERVIRQRLINDGTKIELLVACFLAP